MLYTATGRIAPVGLPMFAACTYCKLDTAERCGNCSTPMCPLCVRGDYCLDCRPAPANVVRFAEWKAERDSYNADVLIAECAGCGRDVANPDDAAAIYCDGCTLPTPARRSCQTCGATLYDPNDGPRCTPCARFIARLDARHAAWLAERGAPIEAAA